MFFWPGFNSGSGVAGIESVEDDADDSDSFLNFLTGFSSLISSVCFLFLSSGCFVPLWILNH